MRIDYIFRRSRWRFAVERGIRHAMLFDRLRHMSDRTFLLLTVLAALALRLDFLFASNFVLDGDEAIVGLMAKHILDGAPVPIFYYGQHYMGSLEAILVAGLFKVFGVSSVAVKSVPLLFSLLLIPLMYRLAREVTGEFGARVAALLVAVPPSPLVIWSAMARGGFIELVVIGAVALLLVCRWLKNSQPSLSGTALIGALLGLGWWVNFQVIYFIGPIGLFMLLHLLRSGRGGAVSRIGAHLVVGVLAFLLGSLPFWLYNIERNFVSFEMFEAAKEGRFGRHLSGLFSVALPSILGAKRFWQTTDVFRGSSLVVWIVYGGALLALLIARRRELLKLLKCSFDSERPVELFLIFIVTVGVVFCASSFGFLVQAPRYLLPIYVGIFVLVGVVVELLARASRGAAVALVGVIIAVNLASSYVGGRAVPGEPFVFNGERVARDHSALIEWLEKNNIGWVRTNYWIGYRLALETEERVRFRVFQEPEQERIESYRLAMRGPEKEVTPLVLVPSQARLVERALAFQGMTHDTIELSGYHVFYNLKGTQLDLTPLDVGLVAGVMASSRNEVTKFAFDGDETTRWGSGEPQKPGMTFQVDFKTPVTLRGLRYDLGAFYSDYPRLLDVDLVLTSGEERHILARDDSVALRYYSGPITLTFEPATVRSVRFTQLGRDRKFDWSIAELQFFE